MSVTDKLDYYDLLGSLIPGILLVTWVPICFPDTMKTFGAARFPEAFTVVAALAAAIFFGQIVQALGSVVEPVLYWSWRGRPSDRALSSGLGRYFPSDAALRIRAKLTARVGPEASNGSLFLYAMQLSDAAQIGRSARFNGLYAYHRSLMVLTLIGILMTLASRFSGQMATWSCWHAWGLVLAMCLLALLAWHRARQRAFYYVREVLLTAEKVMDERKLETRQS